MSEETYEGVPREQNTLGPKIDYEKCITCGKCVDYCHVGAFKFEEKDGEKRTVAKTQTHASYSAEVAKTFALPEPSRIRRKRKPKR